MPDDAVVLTSENGSMEKRLIEFAVEHIARYVRKWVPQDRQYCLTLDGHSSREGWEWLEYSSTAGRAVVQSPANTSHFLQPCDQNVNKTFKQAMRKARDKLSAVTSVDIRTVRVNVMAGMAAYHAITSVSICNSFESTGMWPMDYRFLKRFQNDRARKEVLREVQKVFIASAVQRQNDKAVFEKLKEVVK